MERPLRFLLALIGSLSIIYIVQAQSQQGFISLDCGLPTNETSPYKEEKTGLLFSSDATFIQSGKTGSIQANRESDFLKPSRTLRYFPDGIRNCYNLAVKKGRNYLIRARFVYGNYDGLDISPKFDMYIGPNLWVTIDLGRVENGLREEIIHIPTSNSLQICLVKNGTTTPFISTLEIRPMRKDYYITKSGSLVLFTRSYFCNSSTYLRFLDDVYDRQWPAYFKTEWTQISTTTNVVNNSKKDYDPPNGAMTTAATPTNASAPLTIEWTPDNPQDQFYLYEYFAEIQDLQTNEIREFNILLDGELLFGPFTPAKLRITTIFSESPVSCAEKKCRFQLIRTKKSTLPPLLNALEIYRVIQFPQSETVESDVFAVKNINATYGLSKINWQGDPCVPQQLRWEGLDCSSTNMSTPPRITTLNLSSNGLTGTIAAAIQNLTLLEKLDLSNNNLTGEVPEFLGNMKSLLVINISGNNLSGSIPQSLLRDGLELQKKKPSTVEVVKMKKRRFTHSEVKKMTNNFERVVGEGGFGIVCHSTVNGFQQVAVKLLSHLSTQGYKEFNAEVDLLMRVHHTNLVSLVGYCDEKDHLALMYEFLPNGDLKQHLSGKRGKSAISWGIRLRISVEAALGLEYLHTGSTPPMVHRDVKTANILLEENFKAKIADFGLSRSFPVGGESHVSTVVSGTPRYLDPEYYETSRLSEKSDVYSFGIVLLEMITNQPVINRNAQNSHITEWVGSELKGGDITKIMDPNLNGDYDSNSAWRALELAMLCANPSSVKRPTMSHVVIELKECILSENSKGNMSRRMDSLNSPQVSMVFDSVMIPGAR